jgi:uncharacterized protein (TIGR03435 family)
LITGGEAWTREARFDIDARKDPKASPADVQVMVDRMLAERFALRTHLEPRPMNVYLLKVARADGPLGPTIARSRQACVEARVQQLPVASWPEECRTSRFPRPTGRGSFVNLMAGEMSELTRTLGRMRIDRPILDRTGLSGRFDAALHWNQPEAAAPPTGEETLSLFTAIKEQLGLELAAGREMVNVLVVDGATRPSEN